MQDQSLLNLLANSFKDKDANDSLPIMINTSKESQYSNCSKVSNKRKSKSLSGKVNQNASDFIKQVIG